MIRRFLRDERGATAIEYSLIATLIAMGIIGGLGQFGTALTAYWENIDAKVAAP
ncbi:Flp family type IVb pilin [Aminobacter anthyllidis]|uniref:Flp family type IVb pilin n=1 Tax=Aminobacter anthyllidis TaxID=1035067 RepID=A0A9X1ACN2_9HYPH|nr:Flp family type IVb pilin [Aminobacter anthyllidis]MBT1157317.1 Flp family type IVb pilin [Aminobacter anthyllidis]MDH4987967.1 Flp family type IVb pilin [Aminobacter anthyllidis]